VICDQVARDLDAYMDGELASDSAAAIRVHLDACAPCRQRFVDREALGGLIRSVPSYEAPASLRARVAGQTQRAWPARRLLASAAAAVLAVSVGGALWLVRSTATRGDTTADDVVNGHVRSLMAEHLFDVRSTDQHTVKPWFLGKLDFSPPVVDLAAAGFPLVGGRLDYIAGRPVAALLYQRQKHTINVFVWPESGASGGVTERAIRGFHVRHWVREGMSFWAVSDLNDAELTEFARALRGT
jgi:anti-sigma factor (TIGR02949 family)